MIGLRQTRVIIVDDNDSDALAVARALWRLNIAPVYFHGIEDVPIPQLKGVRLAFLDMDLLGGGTDEKTKLSALVGTLESILAPDNGPYAVIAWTGHPELVREFESYVAREDIRAPRPVHVLAIEKHSVQDMKGDYDLDALLQTLKGNLDEYSGLQFLRAWEEECFTAGNAVVAELSRIAAQADMPDSKDWKAAWDRGLRQIASSLGIAVFGEKRATANSESAVEAFYAGLSPLHADRLESGLPRVAKQLAKAGKRLLDSDVKEKAPLKTRSRLNGMLHCSFEHLGVVHPGNVYRRSLNAKLAQKMRESFFNESDPKGFLDGAVDVMIEVSASCDHAQGKLEQARLIPGILLMAADLSKLRKRLVKIHTSFYLWSLGPVRIDVGSGESDYLIVSNFLYMTSASSARLKKTKALFRLRPEALVDLQSKLGFHVARAGKTLLE